MRAAPLCELLKIFIFYPNMQTVLVHLPPKSKYSQIGYKSVLLPCCRMALSCSEHTTANTRSRAAATPMFQCWVCPGCGGCVGVF